MRTYVYIYNKEYLMMAAYDYGKQNFLISKASSTKTTNGPLIFAVCTGERRYPYLVWSSFPSGKFVWKLRLVESLVKAMDASIFPPLVFNFSRVSEVLFVHLTQHWLSHVYILKAEKKQLNEIAMYSEVHTSKMTTIKYEF